MPDSECHEVAAVLEAWDQDAAGAQRLIQAHTNAAEKHLEAVQLVTRMLLDELSPNQEHMMSFEFSEQEMAAQPVVSIRRHITVPAFHEWMMLALKQLWDHIEVSEAENAGDPVALYYGPVNEKDDGPVEICVPFQGAVLPKGEIKIRELPEHKAVQISTYGEYNKYPKLLEMWNAIGRYVQDQNLEPNWDADMTTYEIWHEDETMTIGWPVRAFTSEDDLGKPLNAA